MLLLSSQREADQEAHAKFTNYKFDVDEFIRLVNVAAGYVWSEDSFPGHKPSKKDEL